jgi:GNAT superfamily N-acetyltransferase
VKWLRPDDAVRLQALFDVCADYALIVDGEPFSPTAAEEEFTAGPPGKALDDKFVYGLVDPHGEIAGLLEGMRDYPEPGVWWIGLLLLAPEVRGQGVGRRLIEGFIEYARLQGAVRLMLGVVEENRAAYRFWEQMEFTRVRTTEPRPFGRKVHAVHVMELAVGLQG